MSEVSAWILKPLFAAVEEAGHDPKALCEDLSVSPSIVGARIQRIPWDDFLAIGERACDVLGGPDALEDLVADFGLNPVSGIVRIFASRLVSARALYTLGAQWLGPATFLCTRGRCEDLPGGELRETIEILPQYRDSELFFRTMRGVLRTAPQMVGQPDAQVELQVEPRRGIYTITLPEKTRTPWRRRLRSAAVGDALTELSTIQEELHLSLAETRARGRVLRAQARRLGTLHRLSRELARHTDIGEVADAVVGLLREHFGFQAIRLSVARRAGDGLEVVTEAGEHFGTASESNDLVASTGVVGRIEFWRDPSDPHEASGDADALLRELLPWIGVALDNARSFEALNDQTARLEAESAERRRAERQLEQAARMDALGRLAGGLAHDVNNVLTAIAGYAELARAELPDDSPARACLDDITAVSERASGLTGQVLAFSRHQVLHPKRVDLNALIARMHPMLRSLVRENIELVIAPDAEASVVVADPGRLEQVVVNLVANARDAISGGGRISIETENIDLLADSPLLRPDVSPGHYVRLRVQDTGSGMDPDTQARAFEPFFTTKQAGEGTGLGLSTTYGTVSQLGGAVDIESEPGKGAAVSILLPRTEQQAPSPAVGAAAVAGGDETVLLVEDDASVRSIAHRVLESRGYRVLVAEHGKQALEVCRSERGPIDLLLTDIVMPGIGGRELARLVLSLRPDLRSVILTSGYEAGASPGPLPEAHLFLRKPYTPDSLLGEVRRMLDTHPRDA